jgi:hypothetical protein
MPFSTTLLFIQIYFVSTLTLFNTHGCFGLGTHLVWAALSELGALPGLGALLKLPTLTDLGALTGTPLALGDYFRATWGGVLLGALLGELLGKLLGVAYYLAHYLGNHLGNHLETTWELLGLGVFLRASVSSYMLLPAQPKYG